MAGCLTGVCMTQETISTCRTCLNEALLPSEIILSSFILFFVGIFFGILIQRWMIIERINNIIEKKIKIK